MGHRLTGFEGFFGEIDPTIIGVVKDFNFRSLHEKVEPAVLNMHPDYYHGMSHILLKIRPVDRGRTIAFLEDVWSRTFPDKPFALASWTRTSRLNTRLSSGGAAS